MDHLWSSRSAFVILQENTEEKFKFKWIAYRTVAENLRVWKWHMAIALYFFSLYWHFMKIITLPICRLSTQFSATKEGFKALWTWCFLPSFRCTSSAAPVTHPGTTRIHKRVPKYRSIWCIYDILNSFCRHPVCTLKKPRTVRRTPII